MDARWYLWRPSGAKPKLELVKLDLRGCPFIEPKGASASQYKGPSADKVRAFFHLPS
jgi:hypothetical protein